MRVAHELVRRFPFRRLPCACALLLTAACTEQGEMTDPEAQNNIIQVRVWPQHAAVETGESVRFLAFGLTSDQDSIPAVVNWAATGGAITPAGDFTAGADPGNFRVTATHAHRLWLADSSTVNVLLDADAVVGLEIWPKEPTMVLGDSLDFWAAALNAAGDTVLRDVTWSVDAGTVERRGQGQGRYKPDRPGRHKVRAAIDSVADSTEVTVAPPPVSSVSVSPSSLTIAVGQTGLLTATPRDAAGNPLTGRAITWTTSPSGVATVNGSGLVTALAAGSATITATSEGKSGSATVTVTGGQANDTTPPVISNGEPSGTLSAGTRETSMSVTTDEAATCKWGTSSSTAYTNLANTFTTSGTSHSTTLTGLTGGQNYTRYVRCQDGAGNANTSSYTISFSVAGGSGSVITGIAFDAGSWATYAQTADLWPIAWAGDGSLYTAGGDGDGFQGPDTRGMTVARVQGPPTAVQGADRFKKDGVLPTGMIAVPGALYVIEEERGGGFDQSRIGKSTDGGVTWTYNGDPLTAWDYAEPDGAFGHASFVNHGQDDAGAPGNYVYVIAGNPINAPTFMADYVDLFRVPRNAVQNRAQHEYFAGFDGNGNPTWTADIAQKAPILARPGRVHWAVRMTWNPVLNRYLLCFFIDTAGTLAVYEGPKPWGPWTKIHEATLLNTTEKFNLSFVNQQGWLSADGGTWWGVFSGLGAYDSFNVIKATLTTGQ